MSAEHHPLELDHHLHPEKCHVVSASADRPQHPREQRGNETPHNHLDCEPAVTFSQQLVLTCNSEPFFFFCPQPWCRLITTIYNYFVVTNFFWMFVEGCYLHTAIVMTYSTDKLRKWVFLFIGWCEYVGRASPFCFTRVRRFTVFDSAGVKQ